MTKKQSEIQDAATFDMRQYINPGDTIYTTYRHTSASGMSRWVDVYRVSADRKIIRITWAVSEVTGYGYDRKHEAIKVGGCGFNAGHSVVYDLACRLFSDPQALKHSEI